jgi:hypothetical protein
VTLKRWSGPGRPSLIAARRKIATSCRGCSRRRAAASTVRRRPSSSDSDCRPQSFHRRRLKSLCRTTARSAPCSTPAPPAHRGPYCNNGSADGIPDLQEPTPMPGRGRRAHAGVVAGKTQGSGYPAWRTSRGATQPSRPLTAAWCSWPKIGQPPGNHAVQRT